MLDTGVIGGAEPPDSAAEAATNDRSMRVLEYLVAVIAMVAAVALTFLR
jgi:hypothetical protein